MDVIIYKWLLVSMIQLSTFSVATDSNAEKSALHPFYISVTEINHNAKDKTLEISCKMFADDFEQILEKNYKKQLDIASAKDKAEFDKLIPDYMERHLNLVVDSKPVHFSYVGYEKDKESVYCYFEVDKIAALKKMDIKNSILHDFNNTQINIMHVVVNGHRQSTKLDFPNTDASFNF
jgi:hypothetical protein